MLIVIHNQENANQYHNTITLTNFSGIIPSVSKDMEQEISCTGVGVFVN